MRLKENVEQSYLSKMKEISEDIWQILDHIEYYKTIRGIWNQYKNDQELTKRQIVRLFDFIYELDRNGNPKTYTKQEIEDAYEKIIKLHIFENVNPLEGIFSKITDDDLLRSNGLMFKELEDLKEFRKNTFDVINTQMKNAPEWMKENLRIIKITLIKGSCCMSDLKKEEDYKY